MPGRASRLFELFFGAVEAPPTSPRLSPLPPVEPDGAGSATSKYPLSGIEFPAPLESPRAGEGPIQSGRPNYLSLYQLSLWSRQPSQPGQPPAR